MTIANNKLGLCCNNNAYILHWLGFGTLQVYRNLGLHDAGNCLKHPTAANRLSGGPLIPALMTYYNGLRGEDMGPFDDVIMWKCRLENFVSALMC